jgi:hypothetical protein
MRFSLVATDAMLDRISQSKRILWSKRIDEVDCAMLPTDIVEMYQFNIDENTGVSTYTKALIEAQSIADFLHQSLNVVPMVTIVDYKWDNPAVVITAKPFGGTDDNGITRTVMSSTGTGTLVNTFVEDEEEAAVIENKKDSRDLTKKDPREQKIRHLDGLLVNGVSIINNRDGKILLPSCSNINLNTKVTKVINSKGMHNVLLTTTSRLHAKANSVITTNTYRSSQLLMNQCKFVNKARAVVNSYTQISSRLQSNNVVTKYTNLAVITTDTTNNCLLPNRLVMRNKSLVVISSKIGHNCLINPVTAIYIALHSEPDGVTEVEETVEDETAGDNPANGMMIGPDMTSNVSMQLLCKHLAVVTARAASKVIAPEVTIKASTWHAAVTSGRVKEKLLLSSPTSGLDVKHTAVASNVISKTAQLDSYQVMKVEATYVIMA